MNPGRILATLWLMFSIGVLVFGLHRIARDRQIEVLGSDLHTGDAEAVARSALALLQLESARQYPRPNIIVQAWGTLRGHRQASMGRALMEARIKQDLARAVTQPWPDDIDLHRLWELAAIIDAELAAAVHVRIAARAGERGAAAAALTLAAATLREAPVDDDPEPVVTAWMRLRDAGSGPGWFTWAARETPPMARAVTAAERAVAQALTARLDAQEEGADPRLVWHAAQAMGVTDRLPDALIARYASQVRIQQVPTMALIACAVMASGLFGGLAFAFHRLHRGRRRIDPGAETLENVEPIELETDALTVQRQVTSEETRVD